MGDLRVKKVPEGYKVWMTVQSGSKVKVVVPDSVRVYLDAEELATALPLHLETVYPISKLGGEV